MLTMYSAHSVFGTQLGLQFKSNFHGNQDPKLNNRSRIEARWIQVTLPAAWRNREEEEEEEEKVVVVVERN